MSDKSKAKSLYEKELQKPEFKRKFEEEYDALSIEVQILNAMEKRDWSYTDLAEAVGTSKSNISRDLKGGGLVAASFSRIRRMVEALGMKLIVLVVPKEYAVELTWRFHGMVQRIVNDKNIAANDAVTFARNTRPACSKDLFIPESSNPFAQVEIKNPWGNTYESHFIAR
jgi:transcriptional regulator with XRE-family HTH domain